MRRYEDGLEHCKTFVFHPGVRVSKLCLRKDDFYDDAGSKSRDEGTARAKGQIRNHEGGDCPEREMSNFEKDRQLSGRVLDQLLALRIEDFSA